MRISLPWNRLGIIAEIASRFHDNDLRLGKTALQKMVYMLQEVSGVNVGYEFSLYTYGPFDSQLLQDLDFVETLKGVSVETVSEGYGGVNITVADETDDLRERSELLTNPRIRETLDRIVTDFGQCSAKELELRSTILFIVHDARRRGEPLQEDQTVSLVHEIKPYFDGATIATAFDELETKGYIQPAV